MSDAFGAAGKVPAPFLERFVYPRCGSQRPEVRTGPRTGVDTAVVDLPGGAAMALTTDPCSLLPSLGMKESAWLTVHLAASDMATTGFAPMYALFDLNLPPTLSREAFEEYWQYIHEFCATLGCAIVGGHTGHFEGQNSTVAGGATMITIAPREQILTSNQANPGDSLILAGECAIAATAILARSFPQTITRACGADTLEAARQLFWRTSSVAAGLAAVRAGRGASGVTAMHDVTEGGVLGALWELAHAADCGLRIDARALAVSPEARAIATVFGLDPTAVVGAGAMIVAVAPGREQAVLDALSDADVSAAMIGTLTGAADGLHLIDAAGTRAIEQAGADPYWQAFSKAMAAGAR